MIFPLFISLAARFSRVGPSVTRNYVQISQLTSGTRMRKAIKHIRSLGYFAMMLVNILNAICCDKQKYRDAPVNIGSLTLHLYKHCTISAFAQDRRRKISSESCLLCSRYFDYFDFSPLRQQTAQYNIITCETRSTLDSFRVRTLFFTGYFEIIKIYFGTSCGLPRSLSGFLS